MKVRANIVGMEVQNTGVRLTINIGIQDTKDLKRGDEFNRWNEEKKAIFAELKLGAINLTLEQPM